MRKADHPCSAERQENPGPYPTRSPLGHLGLLRDDVYLTSPIRSYYSGKMNAIYIYIYIYIYI